MADKGKSALAILVGSPKVGPMGKRDDEDEDETSDDPKAKKLRAIKRLREAFDGGDDKAAAKAFADAVMACQDEDYGSDEDDEKDDDFGGN